MFRSGQEVRCIRADSDNEIIRGRVYEVDSFDGTFVRLNGVYTNDGRLGGWYPGRFVAVDTVEDTRDAQIKYLKQQNLELASMIDFDPSRIEEAMNGPFNELLRITMEDLNLSERILRDLTRLSTVDLALSLAMDGNRVSLGRRVVAKHGIRNAIEIRQRVGK